VRLSWRGILLEIARWPVVLWALINVLLRVKRPYMITPKGIGRTASVSLPALYGPYLALTLVPLVALLGYALSGSTPLRGYYGLALLNAVWGALLLVTTLVIEFRAIGASSRGALAILRARTTILATICWLVGLLGISTVVAWQSILLALR
jgi:cellulose synthase (UDP-forming)